VPAMASVAPQVETPKPGGTVEVPAMASVAPQAEPPKPGGAEGQATVVVFTHAAREADVLAAVAWIDSLSSTRSPTRLLRIEEGPTL